MNKHISPNKKIVNDGLVQIISLVAMVTCVQKNTSIASLLKKKIITVASPRKFEQPVCGNCQMMPALDKIQKLSHLWVLPLRNYLRKS